MKEIQLTQGQVTLVDDEDFDWLNQWKWSAMFSKKINGFYARAVVSGKHVRMHRFILGVTDPNIFVDHIFHNTLDNRRSKLRVCNNAQNQANSRIRKGVKTSKFKGVSWKNTNNKWQSAIQVNKQGYYLGVFDSEKDAAKAYNAAALERFGEFANLNQDVDI